MSNGKRIVGWLMLMMSGTHCIHTTDSSTQMYSGQFDDVLQRERIACSSFIYDVATKDVLCRKSTEGCVKACTRRPPGNVSRGLWQSPAT